MPPRRRMPFKLQNPPTMADAGAGPVKRPSPGPAPMPQPIDISDFNIDPNNPEGGRNIGPPRRFPPNFFGGGRGGGRFDRPPGFGGPPIQVRPPVPKGGNRIAPDGTPIPTFDGPGAAAAYDQFIAQHGGGGDTFEPWQGSGSGAGPADDSYVGGWGPPPPGGWPGGIPGLVAPPMGSGEGYKKSGAPIGWHIAPDGSLQPNTGGKAPNQFGDPIDPPRPQPVPNPGLPGGQPRRPGEGADMGKFRDWWKAQDFGGGGFGYSAEGDAMGLGGDKRLLRELFQQGVGRQGLSALIQDPRLLGSLEGPGGGYGALRDYLGADPGNAQVLARFAKGWENQPGGSSPYGQTANQNAAFEGLPGFYNAYVGAAGGGINGAEDSPYWQDQPPLRRIGVPFGGPPGRPWMGQGPRPY